MTEHIITYIVFVIVLGIGAQWLAWRFKMPSILLLLVFGFLAGPVTNLIPPETLQGEWLFAFVSLAIGIILFEGGLSLRLGELREVGQAVFNLITIGVLVTWILAGTAAYFVLDFPFGLAVLLGAILTVTGPTVVIPLLRHVRPSGRSGAVAKWEGITIDPVGAILAVLVLETVLLLNRVGTEGTITEAALHAVEGLLLTIFVSIGISVLGAGLLILLLRWRLVPDYLQTSIALAVVVGTFALSNVFQEESGLLEVTLLGILMANQKFVAVRRITEFKEDLQVLLISCLFIVLSARLEITVLDEIDGRAMLFLAILILLIRPIAVFFSSIRTKLEWKEQVFLSWLAPRGIVAAAVASLFALRLDTLYGAEVERLVPIVFLVIVGTVAVYGLTISPLARYLGLADPNPQGVLFLGAHRWVQRAAKALHDLGVKVLLIDSNTKNIEQAREYGLPAVTADALSEAVIDELDLSGLGRFLAITSNDEVNALAALHFTEVFENNEVYQLAARPDSREGKGELPEHLRGRPLFGESTNFTSLSRRFQDGGEIRTFELTEKLPYEALKDRYDGDAVLLFAVRSQGDLLIHAEEDEITPQPGDAVVMFLPPFSKERDLADEQFFEDLVAEAFVVDLDEKASYEEIVRQASILFSQRLPIAADRLARGLLESTRYGGAVISQGVSLPHYRIPRIEKPELVLARCKPGTYIEVEDENDAALDPAEPIYALIFLVSPEGSPGQHLRTLAHLASHIGEASFMDAWRDADDEQALREALLHARPAAAPAENGEPTALRDRAVPN